MTAAAIALLNVHEGYQILLRCLNGVGDVLELLIGHAKMKIDTSPLAVLTEPWMISSKKETGKKLSFSGYLLYSSIPSG